MTDRLLALRAFVRTAHSGSLSRAGRELGLSQPSISRILAQLEKEVGARLLVRTTRAVTLTDTGGDYLARVEPLLSAIMRRAGPGNCADCFASPFPPASAFAK
jgi:DNA-binding transcriptional LysR family regulator